MEGQVKWFNNQKGYGFIVGSDNKDYFVHHSNIDNITGFKILSEGQRVSFEVIQATRGLQAVKVQVIEEVKGEQKESNEASNESK